MTENFFNYSKRVLEIDENYTDWLINYFRRQNQTKESLVTGYFDQLQTMKPFVKIITNNSFQSFTIFLVVKAKKQFGEYGPWIIEVAILKEFLFYSYRFFLPTYFLTYQKDFELEIKLLFIFFSSCYLRSNS